MPIYRVFVRNVEDEHQGYQYFPNKRDALKYAREVIAGLCDAEYEGELLTPVEYKLGPNPKLWDWPLIESEPTPKTKADVVHLLNIWANHPDNG